MNFLAHFYLSFDHPPTMVGNFMGDFVKGRNKNDLPAPIWKGITLHRHIDFFTDTHPALLPLKTTLRPVFGKYSGVLLDMFFDHLLAVNWQKYHPVPLDEFAQGVYLALAKAESLFPEKAMRTFHYMQRQNWLVAYQQEEGLERALQGIDYRTGYKAGFTGASRIISCNFKHYEETFYSFFPKVISSAKEKYKETLI